MRICSVVASGCARTCGSRRSGFPRMAYRASPYPSISRTRASSASSDASCTRPRGATRAWLMRILRHEAGHALDNAYRLRRRKRWREVFGPASPPYPARYRARAGSRRYVHHLGEWYAQAHPDGGFRRNLRRVADAEVRLADAATPTGRRCTSCRRSMNSWRACARDVPPVRNRTRIEPLEQHRARWPHTTAASLRTTAKSGAGSPMSCCKRAFTRRAHAPRATVRRRRSCARRRAVLTAAVARALQIEPYSVAQVLRMLIERSEDAEALRARQPPRCAALLALDARAAHRPVLPRRDSAPAPMRRLRTLVVVHASLVPPQSLEGHSEKEIEEWRTEYDVTHDAAPERP